ncbi:multiple ankyrin repeats single kh domain protein [Fusarium subglutinans]|uniref:Multiple ankyrin repeats single kh domain protein n=1 Tax=Gibberella subglutinans TaxID=42677 RepID=A0A8H5V130_GIBSU|nr:multiple ankyrin repeats single kh domain protein [Fusarium subglutinans]KAF5604474.1 multiple ankyrin repeats single kh domain protein [Fusarium subglutinans]
MADPSTYTVGWICALTKELVAAKSFFDEEHAVTLDVQDPADNNSYSFGRMGKHDVVVASLPMSVYGTVSAATVARDMLRTFPNIRVGLMVGIGGGAPSPQHDIRLGDVVVSAPSGTRGGVLNYSHGKAVQQQEFQLTGSLNQPPQLLSTAVGALGADYKMKGHELEERIQEVLSKLPRLKKEYARPVAAEDRLYEISHIHRKSQESAACKDNCGEENLVSREARGDDEDNPMIHYGLIASADILDKDATIRDKLAREQGVLCFEMEAAGLMNHFPCLICFAAMTAAAYAKELLQRIPPTKIREEEPLAKVLGRIGMKLENITTSVKDTNATVNTMHADSQRQKIERWLKPPRPSTNVAKAKKRRHDGTGLWFIQSPEFTEFKAGSRKHLWLHGLAGCGKTVLSSQILDDLSAMDGIITLVHYFDFNDVGKQSLDGLLRSLAFQLYQNGGQEASAKLYELFKSCEDGSKDPGEPQLESCIKSMLRAVDRVFILIDALDECKSRDSLLSWIGRLTVENVQFLLTARPEVDIQPQIFRFFAEENCLSLDKTAVDGDIKSYVLSVLDTNPRFTEKALSEALRKDICSKVGEGADGMFRWAACQMDTLEACLTPNAIREALVSLPRDLPKTYDLNCEQPLSSAEAVEILATRPDRHQGQLRFDPENRLFNSSDVERYCPGMIHIVTVTDEDPDERGDMCRWEEVHLTHFSVKEYLTNIGTFCELDSAVVITETLINYLYDVKDPPYRVRADFPLAIRAEDIWYEFARRAQTVKKIVQMTAKLLLSTANVRKHYRIFKQPSDDWYCSSGRRGKRLYWRSGFSERAESGFFNACLGGLHNTVAYMMEDTKLNVPADEKEACLIFAIFYRFPEVAEVLLKYGISPDASEALGGSAVYKAAKRGFAQLVRELVKAGADLSGDTLDWYGDPTSALCAASENGHLEIVEDLLKAGHHVRIQDSLQRAVGNGHHAIVELLVDWGACEAEPIHDHVLEMAAFRGTNQLVCRLLDARPDGYDKNKLKNALSRACEAGRIDIVRLLVSRGAQADRSINFRYEDSKYDHRKISSKMHNGKGHNCLVLAAQAGNEDIVKILLDKEFDLSQVLDLTSVGSVVTIEKFIQAGVDLSIGEPLYHAVVNGHEQVVRLLLDQGADVNSMITEHDGHPVDPLLFQACSLSVTSDSIAHTLLDHGADYDYRVRSGDTAFHVAAKNGRVSVVERLLHLGDGDKKNSSGHTPLQVASNTDIIRVLLVAGSDANARDDNGWTPLHNAAYQGNPDGIEVLLRYGANAHALTKDGRTALHVALESWTTSDRNMLRIVKLLLDTGVGTNIKDSKGSTPLHSACLSYGVSVVGLLLAKEADVNAVDNEGMSPFRMATRREICEATIDIISLLINQGANVNSQDNDGSTALHCVESSVNLADLLLDHGIIIDTRDGKGKTALFRSFELGNRDVARFLIEKGADVEQATIWKQCFT